jgi:hypothetical protein
VFTTSPVTVVDALEVDEPLGDEPLEPLVGDGAELPDDPVAVVGDGTEPVASVGDTVEWPVEVG